jgi:hypothetical protein
MHQQLMAWCGGIIILVGLSFAGQILVKYWVVAGEASSCWWHFWLGQILAAL